jgi:hypothetical protein
VASWGVLISVEYLLVVHLMDNDLLLEKLAVWPDPDSLVGMVGLAPRQVLGQMDQLVLDHPHRRRQAARTPASGKITLGQTF